MVVRILCVIACSHRRHGRQFCIVCVGGVNTIGDKIRKDKNTQGAFRKPTSTYVTDVIYLEKYSGPKVQVCVSLVVNK